MSAKPLFLRDIFGWSSWVIAFVSEHADLMEAYKGVVLQALIADEICVYGAHLLLERWGLSYPVDPVGSY